MWPVTETRGRCGKVVKVLLSQKVPHFPAFLATKQNRNHYARVITTSFASQFNAFSVAECLGVFVHKVLSPAGKMHSLNRAVLPVFKFQLPYLLAVCS
jgi:hypothetical protein